jgi:hypothetical protein
MKPPKESNIIGEFFSKIYRNYKYNIEPRISCIRGSTRLRLILRRLSTIGLDKVSQHSEDLLEKEFDNLIIIDACRHDLFEEVEGKTDYRITKESHSRGFIRENFSDGDYTDFVVITANPFFHEDKFEQLTDRKIHDVFHEVFRTFETEWDEEACTVRPESIVKNLRTAQKLFPDKRKIVWFIQPHYPFLNSRLKTKDDLKSYSKPGERENNVWIEAEKGKYNQKDLWEPYRKNLEFVLTYVEKCQDILPGDTLLTSDHGNLVGENGLYGHPLGMKVKGVRKVPKKHL